MSGLIGKKIGMTQVFNEQGDAIGVTAIEAGPCMVLSVNDKNVQVGFEPLSNEKKIKKPVSGYFNKLKLSPRKVIREFSKHSGREYKVGEEIKVDVFQVGDYVDVSGISIGKGFQGGMKRWNWSGGPMTHGSMSHRRIGSIGSSTTPGRVWKGHHLPGHMGNVKVTVQNLKVVMVDPENNILVVKGAIPGHDNNYVIINKAKKRKPAADKTAKK
ncbi:MAG: 50S ribosomal protein L3 [Candidatus Omnitrophota bacterium]|jgi:large subunit ribosomal protein L3|nr:MAG: 50S ribosomal protein L3 [Candidatus Omnitrophota bacterium]